MVVDTPYSICSRALVQSGGNQITSFGDNTTESIIAGEIYEAAVQNAISTFPWRFAAKLFALTQLAETPLERYSYYYQVPSDAVAIRAVLFGGSPIEYDRYGDKIACDYNGTLVCDYSYRAAEVYFPAYFTEALVATLRAKFVAAIRRDFSAAEALEKESLRMWAIARNRDSIQQTNRKMPRSNLVTIRG